MQGAVAAGHPNTAEAARLMLEAGGNAFDAILAAMAAACVAEPVLASLGGGGFLLAHPHTGSPRLFDFFVQTPWQCIPDSHFYPITTDFGATQQEFHIGMGSIAMPGSIDGLVHIHKTLGSLPMAEILAPAIHYAREGILINGLQAYIFSLVEPIYHSTVEARRIYRDNAADNHLHVTGSCLQQPELADSLEIIAREGRRPFYAGDFARRFIKDSEENGGHLRQVDLQNFQTIVRQPLKQQYQGYRILSNPGPSAGGLLISFAQQLLRSMPLNQQHYGSSRHLGMLASVMEQTNIARGRYGVEPGLLDRERLDIYRKAVSGHPLVSRGTTHISVIDGQGNAASMTLSNGEGSGYVLPGSGIMLNNMLGEEDLNPHGFNCWPVNRRVSSMMAPTLAENSGRLIAIGSGGSNRLRTAILQTLSNLPDFDMDPQAAVFAPRIHFERDNLHVEPGFDPEVVAHLQTHYPKLTQWPEKNLYFGGTHTVMRQQNQFSGAGDPRRGGVFLLQQ
ncbi:MAG: gamma-glutamyltransferase [Halieaceae bacterium]|nr:gamma-glutamyltransferase [Halieaceae bacterium]